jgi:hypothetical protein
MSDLHSFNIMNSINLQWTRAKNNVWFAFTSFLVWPFFSLVYAIANWRSPWAKNIVWLFCGFFGFTFVISSEGMDANRYRDSLIQLHNSSIGLRDYFIGVKEGVYGRGDYLEPMIRYMVSFFTDDYRVLFMIFGLVMGYFYSRNIWTLLEATGGRIKPYAYPLLGLLIFLVPFWQINGFRFWTATHIFLYAVFQLYYHGNYKRALTFLVLTILTHVSFLLPVTLLVAFHLVPKKNWFFIGIFLSSLFLVNLSLPFLVSLIPETMEGPAVDLVRSYTHEGYVAQRSGATQNLRWYVKYQSVPVYFYTILISIILLIGERKFLKAQGIRMLLYSGILIFSMTNILKVIPSSGRFYTTAYFLIFAALFFMAHQYQRSRAVQGLLWLSTLCVLLPIAVQVRIGMMFLGPGTVFYSPFFAWALENYYVFYRMN